MLKYLKNKYVIGTAMALALYFLVFRKKDDTRTYSGTNAQTATNVSAGEFGSVAQTGKGNFGTTKMVLPSITVDTSGIPHFDVN